MADLKVEGAELKQLVKLGKKRSLSFGFCPGPKADHTLLIDRRKSPEMLGKLARQEGSSPKVAFGTFEVKGRTMEMTCGRTVPQMAKVLKKYLKTQKITINVVVLDAEGNTVDSDVEDLAPDPSMEDDADTAAIQDDADDEVEAPAPAAADDQAAEAADDDAKDGTLDAASLAARLKALKPAVTEAAPDVAAKLGKVMAAAVAQIKAATLEQADATVTALENAVARLGEGAKSAEPATPADDEADFKALAVRAQALKGAIEGIAAPAKDKLMAALTDAVKQIRERNHDTAATILGKIETAVGKLTAATPAASADDGKATPADVAPFVQSRDAWIETRKNLRQEMTDLKSAIDTATANVDGFEDVPKKSGILLDHIDDIDSGLETTLDQIVKTPDEAKREELKAGARKIIETYRGVLDTDFFKAVDNNGFIKTNIRGSALDSLQKVSAALSA
ncbi:hypothetical protein QO034_17170 [Sedimentitalea sp. JM2-8]|uniref:Uncharacterized protein n=1 Tax=Sedimentitalea xiamensis TaxID=3050037 RepID=A0ABT7FI65_9RHOB|nr:hypothetical protein [Sedimentitalea xiamensis]MDK3074821.1 hypothetical protein [Sedimentitalea xiamensis]